MTATSCEGASRASATTSPAATPTAAPTATSAAEGGSGTYSCTTTTWVGGGCPYMGGGCPYMRGGCCPYIGGCWPYMWGAGGCCPYIGGGGAYPGAWTSTVWTVVIPWGGGMSGWEPGTVIIVVAFYCVNLTSSFCISSWSYSFCYCWQQQYTMIAITTIAATMIPMMAPIDNLGLHIPLLQ